MNNHLSQRERLYLHQSASADIASRHVSTLVPQQPLNLCNTAPALMQISCERTPKAMLRQGNRCSAYKEKSSQTLCGMQNSIRVVADHWTGIETAVTAVPGCRTTWPRTLPHQSPFLGSVRPARLDSCPDEPAWRYSLSLAATKGK